MSTPPSSEKTTPLGPTVSAVTPATALEETALQTGPGDKTASPDATALAQTGIDPAQSPGLAATMAAPTQVSDGRDEAAAPALAAEAEEKNLSTLRDFRLDKKLGEGGMGTVYKAHQISLDRTVAIKVPFKHLAKDRSFVDRFYREARIMARLDHPHILRCFSVGEENGWHYLAMEFIDGASMQSWLGKLGKLSIGDALHITLACAYALEHAHDQGLIHRDIKPDNVLITNKGIVKVADMGLAKALEDDLSLSRTGTGAGTPHYMAPEQARDAKHVDGRSDIYALGSMLYCFLTGKPPFNAETYVELVLEKEKGKYPPTRRSNPNVPDRLDLIIDKMVAAKPDSRYRSCADVIKDLEGLGMANETLSFIPGAIAPSGGRTLGSMTRQAPPPAAKPAAAGTPAKPAASTPAAPSVKAGLDMWFLRSVTDKGKYVKRKLSTAQIVDLIKQKDFDLDSEVSRSLKGPYRNLHYHKEFEHILTSRLVKAKADRRAAKVKGLYDEILKDEKSFYTRRSIKNMLRSTWGWVTLIALFLLLAGGAFVVFHFVLGSF